MFRTIRVDHTNCLQVAIKTHSFVQETESLRVENARLKFHQHHYVFCVFPTWCGKVQTDTFFKDDDIPTFKTGTIRMHSVD